MRYHSAEHTADTLVRNIVGLYGMMSITVVDGAAIAIVNTLAGMPRRVAEALLLYVTLGSRRSLRSISETYRADGKRVSLPTLKRWSARYDWQQQVAAYDAEVIAQANASLESGIRSRREFELRAAQAAKQRFYERVLLDPSDPALTKGQRHRALRPTVRDFCAMVKLERMLLAEMPVDTRGAEERHPPTDEEIELILDAIAEKRYGLPPRHSA